MKRARLMLAVAAASLVFASPVWAQPAKPGPEFEMLKKLAGDWDMVAKSLGAEGKGTMSCKMELGGLWLTAELKAELAGQKFEQKGMGTYDATKKKYVFVWANSVSTILYLFEGTYDEAGKKLSTTGELPGPAGGKPMKFKMVVVAKNDDNFVQTMSVVGEDGKEQEIVTITYTRRK